MLTDVGKDLVSDATGSTAGYTSTAGSGGSAPTATTLTDSGSPGWTTDQWKGNVVVSGAVYGVILSNTSSVLTVDKWYVPATPGGSAGTTPSASATYTIVPGNQSAFWLAITTNATAPGASDTTLASELSSNGLSRKVAAYAHTDGAASAVYTLTATWTCSGGSQTIAKAGVFQASSGGRMLFTTLVSSAPTLVSGDQLTITETATIS